MKRSFFYFLLMCTLPLASAFSNTEVMISPEDLHIPMGFDENDREVEIAVSVVLPNTCYRRPFGKPTIIGNRISVDMKATKIASEGVFCIQALIPSLVTVPLGPLAEGEYEVRINEGSTNEKISTLSVTKPASISVDNFNYANVNMLERSTGGNSVVLKGYHPSSCMDIDRVEMYLNEDGNTYSVLPILKTVGDVCDRVVKPFSVEVPLWNNPAQNVTVFHVRTVEGRAFNWRW